MRSPFLLGTSATALGASASWEVCSFRAVFQRRHGGFDHCGPLCQFCQKRGTEQPVEQIQKCPGSGPNPETQDQTLNLVQNCCLWKTRCDGWVECLGNPWKDSPETANPTWVKRSPDHGACLLFDCKTPGKLMTKHGRT